MSSTVEPPSTIKKIYVVVLLRKATTVRGNDQETVYNLIMHMPVKRHTDYVKKLSYCLDTHLVLAIARFLDENATAFPNFSYHSSFQTEQPGIYAGLITGYRDISSLPTPSHPLELNNPGDAPDSTIPDNAPNDTPNNAPDTTNNTPSDTGSNTPIGSPDSTISFIKNAFEEVFETYRNNRAPNPTPSPIPNPLAKIIAFPQPIRPPPPTEFICRPIMNCPNLYMDRGVLKDRAQSAQAPVPPPVQGGGLASRVDGSGFEQPLSPLLRDGVRTPQVYDSGEGVE
ncbi:hypothetical protein BDV25DRAFT_137480 [Aspergillus avenaceus]|uniref:Uncharacterized protein n=1 Tax=Aspergillus avenaceus TaxID=36643 RepID=A0A5N6U2E3_ASPAV|nr:hypothetical protein BDV25DRAFT_137480 [Aspergillus avenaceus]